MRSFKFIGGSLQGKEIKAPGDGLYVKFNPDDDEFPPTEYYTRKVVQGPGGQSHDVYLLSDLCGFESYTAMYMKEAGL